MMTIMFTGHRNSKRDAKLDLVGLENLLKKLISKKSDIHFIAGGCPGFDTLAMNVLKDLGIPETSCTIFLPANSPVLDAKDPEGTEEAKRVYERIDKKVFIKTTDSFAARCMMRNQLMVLEADICITNLAEKSGGTFQTIKMAKAKGSMIYYIKGDRYESHPIE